VYFHTARSLVRLGGLFRANCLRTHIQIPPYVLKLGYLGLGSDRMVEFFLHYVQGHKTDTRLLEQETSNVLAAVETMLERGMYPAGASAFAYFIRLLRKSRAI